jgi:hypothetical protein
MGMENLGVMISTGEAPNSATRDLWQFYLQSHLVENQEKLAKKVMNLALRSISFIFRSFLICRKIFQQGADNFTSSPKEGILQTFVALKNLSPSAGFEVANLGSNSKLSVNYTAEDDKWGISIKRNIR